MPDRPETVGPPSPPAKTKANILLVDDNPANLMALRAVLDDLDQNLVEARSGEEALIRLRQHDFAVVLLDVQMPGLDGFETATLMRRESKLHVPIIFLTAFESDRFPVERAYSLGAVDYLVKPFAPVVVRAKVAGFVELFEKTRQIQRQAEELRAAERQRFDRSAEEQQEWFRVTLASIGDAVITTDTAGLVTFMNAVAQRLTGWAEADAKGQPSEIVFRIRHEQTGQPVENPIAAVLNEGRVVERSDPIVLVTRNGAAKPIADCAAPIRGSDGTLLGVVLTFRDVTEQRRSQRDLADFFENVTVGIHWVGPDGTILRANKAELDLLGYAPEEYVGHNIVEFHADLDVICDILERLKSSENLRDCPARMRCKDGSIRHVLIHSSVLFEEGRFVHTRCITRDVTDRRRAEVALEESEERLRLLANTIPQMAWMARPDGFVFWYNRRWYDYTGATPDETEGWGWQAVADTASLPEVLKRWKGSLATGEPFDMVAPLRGKDGKYRPFLTRVNPLWDRDGRIVYWFGTNTDVSEIKSMEEALRDADRRKDEFLATLAHELRNPLAPIRNALEVLRLSQADATTKKLAGMMQRQVHHLVRLVDDLLDVSRVMRGKIELRKERVELSTVAASAVETAKPSIETQGHQLDVSVASESLTLDADPVRLAQVVGNLLTNAAKYTEPNGRIWLTVRREEREAILSVRDSGIGIAPELLPHVFELFVQADHASTRSQGGLGIGLTLVKNLVDMHGGKVEARSAGLGHGCEFVVRLPLAATGTEWPGGSGGVTETRPTISAPGHRLMVVDDNRDAADSLAELLRLQGHEVHVAHDGPAALALAHAYRPDLIFLDIGMPGMDGHEVARRLRQQPGMENVVLAALTGWGQKEDRRRTADAGFNHHLVKPPEPKAVEGVLAELKRSDVR